MSWEMKMVGDTSLELLFSYQIVGITNSGMKDDTPLDPSRYGSLPVA